MENTSIRLCLFTSSSLEFEFPDQDWADVFDGEGFSLLRLPPCLDLQRESDVRIETSSEFHSELISIMINFDLKSDNMLF